MVDDSGTVTGEDPAKSSSSSSAAAKKQRRGIFSWFWRGPFEVRSEDYEKRLQYLSKEEAIVHARMKRRAQSSRRMMWERTKPDLQYISHLDVDWIQTLKTTEKLDSRNRDMKIGLLNVNVTEINHWQQLLPHAEFSVIHLDHVQRNLTWEDLYPEWIDEEGESEVPSCPKLPEPKVRKGL